MRGLLEIPFVKMQGIGNDYIYIDDLKGDNPEYLEEKFLPELSRKISDRHFGIGSDGLILILPSDKADFRMRIFNSDGSEAKMCGNGVRCVGKYVYDLGFTTKKHITVETESGIKYLELQTREGKVESVIVNMGSPFFNREDIPAKGQKKEEMNDEVLKSEGCDFKITGVSMGNPHGIVFVNDIDSIDIFKHGPNLEKNDVWVDRANIEFVRIKSAKEIDIRVWERGSGETLACGTGACASTVVSYRKGLINDKVIVHLKGGDLKVYYDEKNNKVMMEGPAEFVATGTYFFSKEN